MAVGMTEQLAIHTAKTRYEDIPPEAIEKAKDCILDQIGVELIGSTLEWNKIAHRYVAEMGGRGESTVVNYGNRVPMLDAAFVNATFGQGCELDDLLRSICDRDRNRVGGDRHPVHRRVDDAVQLRVAEPPDREHRLG